MKVIKIESPAYIVIPAEDEAGAAPTDWPMYAIQMQRPSGSLTGWVLPADQAQAQVAMEMIHGNELVARVAMPEGRVESAPGGGDGYDIDLRVARWYFAANEPAPPHVTIDRWGQLYKPGQAAPDNPESVVLVYPGRMEDWPADLPPPELPIPGTTA